MSWLKGEKRLNVAGGVNRVLELEKREMGGNMRKIERDEERPIVSHCSANEPVWPFSSLNNLSSLCRSLCLPLALSLSLHISLYVPVTDLDTNNFSPFISTPCFSSRYILLSSNKILKRYTSSIHSADNRPSQSALLSSGLFSFMNVVSLLRLPRLIN